MASSAFECKLCLESYNSQNRKPLCLDCGHTFCQTCLGLLARDNHRVCATCRMPATKPVDELPVIYDLIPSDTACESPSPFADKCQDHEFSMDQFCLECKVAVCKKCVKNHATHRVLLVYDVLKMDPSVSDFTRELKNKIDKKIENLTVSISLTLNACDVIEKLTSHKTSIEKLKDRLCSEMRGLEELLEAWSNAKQKSPDEKQKLFKELSLQWKGEALPSFQINDVPAFVEKIKQLNEFADLLEEFLPEFKDAVDREESPNEENPFVDGGVWRVRNEEGSELAVASARAGNTPAALAIVSLPTSPIRQLNDVLPTLGSACEDCCISVKDLEAFWASSNVPQHGGHQGFIEKFGHHVYQFYGSPREAIALCRTNPDVPSLGVRLASTRDVTLCSGLSEKLQCVSCIRSLPASASARMVQLDLKPLQWHFPDVWPADSKWMTTLMECGLNDFISTFPLSVYLPRCHLTEEDFYRLSKKCYRRGLRIYCEHSNLSESAKSKIEAKCAPHNVIFRWSINVI